MKQITPYIASVIWLLFLILGAVAAMVPQLNNLLQSMTL